jgi:hypothetical protein
MRWKSKEKEEIVSKVILRLTHKSQKKGCAFYIYKLNCASIAKIFLFGSAFNDGLVWMFLSIMKRLAKYIGDVVKPSCNSFNNCP